MVNRKFLSRLLVGLLILTIAGSVGVVYFGYFQTVNAGLTFSNALHVPPILDPELENGEKVYTFSLQKGNHAFIDGQPTATLGFNGDYLGPTIKVDAGDLVRFNITNELDEVSTVHWHGMHVPPEMDGTPHQPIAVGETWQPYYEIKNEASTMWYHPHTHGRTAHQSYFGLAAFFIIEDDNSKSLAIPQTYGVDDFPLAVQDRRFTDTGDLFYPATGNAFLGDSVVVNGTYAPQLTVAGKRIRLRLLNGSNSRIFRFAFSDGRTFHQIATDGGLLAAPVALDQVKLSPGERAEIVVDFSDNTDVKLISLPDTNLLAMAENAFEGDSGRFDILQINVQPTDDVSPELPSVLNVINGWDESEVDRVRTMRLAGQMSQDANAAADSAIGSGRQIPINGKLMNMARVDEVVTLGDIEIWEITNMGGVPHPFHVHDVQFLVVDRDGDAPPANEQGWKDTTLINAGETVRIIAQFTDFASEDVPYMYHCHIMEHEDNGMMGQFTVVEPDSALAGSDGYMLELNAELHGEMEH